MTLKPRYLVIELSVSFENSVSTALSLLLDIELNTSQSFGSSSRSLSFSNKLTLLSDIKAIDQKDRVKFDYFSEIRNKFAHVENAKDFTSCYSAIDMGNKLRKLYPNVSVEMEEHNEEELNKRLFLALFEDLMNIFRKVMESVQEKAYKKGTIDAKQKILDNLVETLQEYTASDPDLYSKMSEVFRIATDKTKAQINSED